MNNFQEGIRRIQCAIKDYNWPIERTIFIEGLKNFGDVLHSSVVVRHYKNTFPDYMVVWGVSERYYEQFDEFAEIIGVVVVPLPHEATPEDRQNWKKEFNKFGFFKSLFPLCAVSGHDRPGNIVDNVLYNADISSLVVPRKPFFPHSQSDYVWHDNFSTKYGLKGKKYVVLEYNSYTLSKPPHNITWDNDKYNILVKNINYPVVFTGHKDDLPLNSGVDARGITFRQAKIMIERGGCVVGCGSGISVLSCCEGLNTYVFEINIGNPLPLKNIYGIKSISCHTDNPLNVAKAVNLYMDKINA